MVKISCDADWKTELETMFLKLPIDDPVLFNPGLPQPARHRKTGSKYNPAALLRSDATSAVDATMQTIFKNAVKEAT